MRLAVVDFEYVRATPRVGLARLQAEVTGGDGDLGAAPRLLVIGARAHRARALPDPAGWLRDLGDDRWAWRLAWPVPIDLLTGRDSGFLVDLPGAALLSLPAPAYRQLADPGELVGWAPGGRMGLVAALLACGAIAIGVPATDAHAQEAVQTSEGAIVISADCQPSGTLPDGRQCALPACPEGPSDGTPCVETEAQRAAREQQAAAPAPAPAQSAPAAKPKPKPAAAPAPKAQKAPKRRPAKRVTAAPKKQNKAAKPEKAGRKNRADRPAAELTPDRAFKRARREARAERRAQLERKRAAQRRADQLERRKASELRSLARTIDQAQDAPLTGGLVLPGLLVPDPPEPPGFLMPIYKEAGKKYGIPWQILASINEIESQYGRLLGPSSAGAVGWMQFMPATWKAYGVDADGDGTRDPNNPRDAIFAAARYLEASGARVDLPRAIYAYNHAQWYVQAVLLRAREMRWRDPEVTKLLRMRRWQLERRILADERIQIYDCGREDIREHRVDRRVLLVLQFLANSGLHPTVSSLDCGHSLLTKSGNISHHTFGGAVDISAINGTPIMGNQGPGSVGEAALRRLLTLRGLMAPDQIISLIEVTGAENTFSMGDHADHIHIGFRPRKDVRAKREKLKRRLARKRFERLYPMPDQRPGGITGDFPVERFLPRLP